MPFRRNAILGVLALLLCPAIAPAADAPVALEEVVVTGGLTEIRKELIKAEDRFFERYNELIDNRDHEIHCSVEQPIGSRVPRRYCRTGYETSALSQAGREAAGMMQNYYNDLRMGVAQSKPITTTSVTATSVQSRHEEFRRHLRETVIHDGELLKTLVRHAQLTDLYNRKHAEMFGTRSRK